MTWCSGCVEIGWVRLEAHHPATALTPSDLRVPDRLRSLKLFWKGWNSVVSARYHGLAWVGWDMMKGWPTAVQSVYSTALTEGAWELS